MGRRASGRVVSAGAGTAGAETADAETAASETGSSGTIPPSVRVDVSQLRGDPRLNLAAGGQPHGDQGARMGEMGRYLGEADGPAQRRGHPAGGDPSGDPRTTGPGARAVAAPPLHG